MTYVTSKTYFFKNDHAKKTASKQLRRSVLLTSIVTILMANHSMAADEPKPSASSISTQKVTENTEKDTPASQKKSEKPEDINKILDALHIKKAVEKGFVDESVLTDYKQNTIDGRPKSPSAQNTATDSQNGINTQLNKQLNNNQFNHAINGQNESQSSAQPFQFNQDKQTNQDNQTQTSQVTLPDMKAMADTDIKAPLPEGSVSQQAKKIQAENPQTLSIANIEHQLNQINQQLKETSQFNEPTSTLEDEQPPIGLANTHTGIILPTPSNSETLGLTQADTSSTQAQSQTRQNSNAQDASAQSTTEATHADNADKNDLSPEHYLPDYQPEQTNQETIKTSQDHQDDEEAGGNVFKRLYNHFFNDGYDGVNHIKTTVYQAKDNDKNRLIKADKDAQPAKNIKTALDQFSVDSVLDFTAALPRIRQEAENAAKAVGYYDVKFRFEQPANDKLNVIIESLGKPVIVTSRIFDIRGQGSELPEYQALSHALPPLEGDVLNQGEYTNSKFVIDTLSNNYGFFDARWLNQSVDVILPDNTADIDLIYNTGERYHFDYIVFFTIDKETGKPTTDPNKLPVKPELLKKLLTFHAGDAFNQPELTKFSNNLAATRYFNTVNVETITPANQDNNAGTLTFDNSDTEDDYAKNNQNADTLDGAKDDGDKDDGAKESMTTSSLMSGDNTDNHAHNNANEKNTAELVSKQNKEPNETTAQALAQQTSELNPINFSVDEQTQEKLLAIKQKADRLLSLPDDRVLDEQKAKSQSLLGRISDGISHIAETILPDEKDEDLFNVNEDTEFLAQRQTPKQVEESKKIPVYVFVLADKPRDAQFGYGYGTDTGARITAKFDNNLVNRDGYQVGIEGSASRINKNLTAYASKPWHHPLNDKLQASLSYDEEVINQGKGNFDLSTKTIEARLARNIRKESGWNRSYSLRYRLDELDSGINTNLKDDLPINFTSAKPKQQAVLLGYGMSKTQLDNPANPTQGFRQQYSLEAGAKNAGTDTNMAILKASVGAIRSFGEWNNNQVIGRLETGYLWADDFYDVPYKLRFFAGGDQSIRGYDYNSLSPLSKNGFLEGGQILAVTNLEYNYQFKPGWRAAVFTDIGNAYDKDFKTPTKAGVGMGIRWASPVGMVRVDLAAGVTEKNMPVRLYFFIGPPL